MRRRTTLLFVLVVAAVVAGGCASSGGVEIGRSDAAESSVESVPDTTVPASTDPSFTSTTEIVEDFVCPAEDGSSPQIQTFSNPPPVCLDPSKTYSAVLTTNLGVLHLSLDADAAPIAVNNFVFLAGYHYFDDTTCHRIIPGFVFQCGDPTGTGTGGPGYEFPDELPPAGAYEIGSLAMANAGADTNGSQFFVVTGPDGVALLDPSYTLFGQVDAADLDLVDQIDSHGTQDGTPTSPVDIESVTIVVS